MTGCARKSTEAPADAAAAIVAAFCALPAACRLVVAQRIVAELSDCEFEALVRRQRHEAARRRVDAEASALLNLRVGCSSGNPAREIAGLLRRYASSAWRFERELAAPHDPSNAAAHQFLRAVGRAPSEKTIRRHLAMFSI